MKGSVYFALSLFGVLFASASSTSEICASPMDQGSGEEQQLKFFYSTEKSVCLPFHYKGAGGNDNRFDSDNECSAACSENHAEIYPEGDAVCVLPKEQGMCYGRHVRYFYSTEEQTCRTFIYGGCMGNGNRFSTREDCQATCQAKGSRSGGAVDSGPNPDAHSTNSGLIAAVLGGCIFAVAIISVIAALIKNKTKDRKKVPTQDLEMSSK
ncbi:hypothetical protein AAFF_G00030850 [Aldrovandia affinis]|uniref:BPTI/Kunitz inhibitor domain-containing protein n=1 Tax=Aldrovandia affinis TaxID=143900 RepID=A0AAD7S444_9TELE|nr:hypothetical protein AAFF_G00030850 [Aldrovandia affinis]